MQADIEARPLLFNSFMPRDGCDTPIYEAVSSAEALKKALDEKLAEFNENNAGEFGLRIDALQFVLVLPSYIFFCSHGPCSFPASNGACFSHHPYPGPTPRPCNACGGGRIRFANAWNTNEYH